MLSSLHIRNFILIDELAVEVGGGLTALTGETGAGKSILLDALALALGGRLDRGGARSGAPEASAAAAFRPPADHPVWALLEENGLADGGDELILRRAQTGDGRSRAFINDQPVSVSLLKSVGESLVEIHGQHDGRGFLSATMHRDMLDEYGGHGPLRARTRLACEARRTALETLAARKAGRDRARAEADYLRHVVAELGALAPRPDEEAALAGRRAALQAAEKITTDLAVAAELLADGEGLEGRLAAAARRLARAASAFPQTDNPLAAAVERVEAALSAAMEARAAVEETGERIGADPAELERTEERLFALRAAARKHGVAVDGLAGALAAAKAALAELDAGEAGFGALEEAARNAERAYAEAAGALSLARRKAAAALDKSVAAELAPLKLEKAAFRTEVATDEDRPGPDGVDAVEFRVRTNPGAPEGPLKTIASGGELSRFVLAMKAALAAKERRLVVIFDEVDQGVGGAVADAVGERLARLAQAAQVLVVTHSPQVAARASHHWRVEKLDRRGAAETRIAALTPDERVEEIARMLSGASITDEARAAARRLLGAPAATGPTRRRRA
jgi:DNA repair protein RecN (Recombination protein N)